MIKYHGDPKGRRLRLHPTTTRNCSPGARTSTDAPSPPATAWRCATWRGCGPRPATSVSGTRRRRSEGVRGEPQGFPGSLATMAQGLHIYLDAKEARERKCAKKETGGAKTWRSRSDTFVKVSARLRPWMWRVNRLLT